MRTPKKIRESKKNKVLNQSSTEKILGNITISTNQITWGDNRVTRNINVYYAGSQRQPWEPNYQEDIESYEFNTAAEANKKYLELITKYTK